MMKLDGNLGITSPALALSQAPAAGQVGEQLTATGTAVALTSTASNPHIASLSVSAGTWDISGWVSFNPAATTSMNFRCASIGITANAIDLSNQQFIQDLNAGFVTGGSVFAYAIPIRRYTFATPTTVYLGQYSQFTISTCTGSGKITATRVA